MTQTKTSWTTTSHRNACMMTPTIALITLDPPDLRFWITAEWHVTVFVRWVGSTAFGDACLYVPVVHSDVTDAFMYLWYIGTSLTLASLRLMSWWLPPQPLMLEHCSCGCRAATASLTDVQSIHCLHHVLAQSVRWHPQWEISSRCWNSLAAKSTKIEENKIKFWIEQLIWARSDFRPGRDLGLRPGWPMQLQFSQCTCCRE